MMKAHWFCVAAVSVGLAACAQPDGATAPAWTTITTEAEYRERVVGKTLSYAGGAHQLVVEPDGTFSGDTEGTWYWEADKFCRVAFNTQNGREFPLQCQTIQVAGDQLRVIRPNGEITRPATISG